MRGKIVKLINKSSAEKVDYENYNKEDIYVHIPSSNDTVKYPKPQDILIEDILKNDNEFIERLRNKSGYNLKIETLDHIPFQFFLSAPKDSNAEHDWFVIVIFSNYYSLGYENSVVSFHSKNPTLCKGLRSMFEKLIEAQGTKDRNQNPIKRLFAGSSEINIVLKCIDLDKDEVVQQIGYNSVTPVPDIMGKDDLFVLFKDSDVKYNPATINVKKRTNELEQIISNSVNNKTYFSVGVFYNPLTQALSDCSNNPLFKLDNRGETRIKNTLRIAVGGTVDSPILEPYEDVFDHNKEPLFDYAFFCKLKVNDKWMFAGGGLNYFGSRHIEECIKYGATKINEQIINKPFIMLFKVHTSIRPSISFERYSHFLSKESLSDIDLLLISYIDEDNSIKCNRNS